jgi:hypothetical protein
MQSLGNIFFGADFFGSEEIRKGLERLIGWVA